MRILLRKKLSDGRKIMVYDDGTQFNNIVVVISNNNIPNKTIKLSDEGEKWRDDVPKILGVSKEELGLDD